MILATIISLSLAIFGVILFGVKQVFFKSLSLFLSYTQREKSAVNLTMKSSSMRFHQCRRRIWLLSQTIKLSADFC